MTCHAYIFTNAVLLNLDKIRFNAMQPYSKRIQLNVNEDA